MTYFVVRLDSVPTLLQQLGVIFQDVLTFQIGSDGETTRLNMHWRIQRRHWRPP